MSQNKQAESPMIKRKCEVKQGSRQMNDVQSKPDELSSIEEMLKRISLHQLIADMIKDDTLENYLAKIIRRVTTKKEGDWKQNSNQEEKKIQNTGWGTETTAEKVENQGWGNSDWNKQDTSNDNRRDNGYNRERNGNRQNQNFGQNQDNKTNDWKQGGNRGRQYENQKGASERRFSDQSGNFKDRENNSYNKFGRDENQRSNSSNQGDYKKPYERKDWNGGQNQGGDQYQKKREWTDRKPNYDQGSNNRRYDRNNGQSDRNNGQTDNQPWKNKNENQGGNPWGSNETEQKQNEWGQSTSNQWGVTNEPASPINPQINPLAQSWQI